MKLELIRRSERADYVCYGVGVEENKLWKIYIPRMAMRYNTAERMIVFVSMVDKDETKHTCHKCGKTYPKFKYKNHAKRHSN